MNRAAVAEIVFGTDDESKAALKDLNGIVHPAMQAEILRQIKIGHDGGQHVVLDFPLLAENPRDDLDATIVVDIDPEIAVERLVNIRGMDESDARNRIANRRLGRSDLRLPPMLLITQVMSRRCALRLQMCGGRSLGEYLGVWLWLVGKPGVTGFDNWPAASAWPRFSGC